MHELHFRIKVLQKVMYLSYGVYKMKPLEISELKTETKDWVFKKVHKL